MLLLDIMLNDRFKGQLRYTKRGFPKMGDDGKIVEAYDIRDLQRFVEEQRPSLKGKNYTIEISNQKVLCQHSEEPVRYWQPR